MVVFFSKNTTHVLFMTCLRVFNWYIKATIATHSCWKDHFKNSPRTPRVVLMNNLTRCLFFPCFFFARKTILPTVNSSMTSICRSSEVSLFSAFSLAISAGIAGSYWQCAILAITLWFPSFVWAYRYHCFLLNRKYVSCPWFERNRNLWCFLNLFHFWD